MHSTRTSSSALSLSLAVLATLALVPAARAADYRLEKRLPLAAAGSFSLASEAGGIEVRGGEGSEAVVVITSTRSDFAELYEVRFDTPRPDRVEVSVRKKSRGAMGWLSGGSGNTRITVALPKSAAIEIESSGGGIAIADLDGGVVAESSGGGVDVTNLGGAARLSSSGGSIEAVNVAGEIEASSSGGSVEIREAHDRVVAESSGGGVSVHFAAGNAKGGQLESSGGGVAAQVDPTVGLEIDASSSGGAVACDLPLTVRGTLRRDRVHGTLNGGGPRLELSSSGGGIAIGSR